MSDLTITTNKHWRDFITFFDLSDAEQAELEGQYPDEDTTCFCRIIRYYGNLTVIDASDCDFLRWDTPWTGKRPDEFSDWNAYQSNGYSLTLLNISDCGEQYQIGTT